MSRKTVRLEWRIRSILLMVLIPMTLLVVGICILSVRNSLRYQKQIHNVTTASEFNQNFKSDIDLKMYYYVIESSYSEGVPLEEVANAQQLAERLLETTTDKDSREAIRSVQNLCDTLQETIDVITRTEGYDDRQMQLENNVYVLTDLIQEYMYHYLYCEAVHLDALQDSINRQLATELVLTLVVLVTVVGVVILRGFRLGKAITSPIRSLCDRVEAIGGGDLEAHTPIPAREYEIQTLSNGFEQMVTRLNDLMETSRQEQMRLRSTELALLQAQINPHFLYNTLDTIIWLIETAHYEQAVGMVSNLSDFFRSSLSRGRDVITLEEEERHVRSYLEIQQVRYRDILDFSIEIDPALSRVALPKLTLQPLVENALYHGIKLKRGKGTIQVTGYAQGTDVVLRVSDNGVGMSPQRLQALRENLGRKEDRIGFGLFTVHERLQLFFGSGYDMELESKEQLGTTITLRLPCGTGKETEQCTSGS